MTKKKAVKPKGKEETVKEASSVSQDSKKIEKAKAAPSTGKYKPLKIKDMCDFMEENWKKGIFGGYTSTSPACVECLEDFRESAEACIANTKVIQAKESPKETTQEKTAPTKEKAAGTPVEKKVETPAPSVEKKVETVVPAAAGGKPKAGITRSPLGSDISKGTGKIELLLLSKEGASMKEMEACRGCVQNCLRVWRKKGVTIVKKEVSGEVRYFVTKP